MPGVFNPDPKNLGLGGINSTSGLGHELGHAWLSLHKGASMEVSAPPKEWKTGRDTWFHESNATRIQNQIYLELGGVGSLRDSYNGVAVPNFDEPLFGSDKKGFFDCKCKQFTKRPWGSLR